MTQHVDAVEWARRMRAAGDTVRFKDQQFSSGTVAALLDRIDRYEKNMPSWADGTPEDYDAWLRELTPVDQRLKFYQWIGAQAVIEAIDNLMTQIHDNPVPAPYRVEVPEEIETAIELLDPRRNADPLPSVLPKGKHMCDVQWHTHTNGMGYLPTCRIDSEEDQ